MASWNIVYNLFFKNICILIKAIALHICILKMKYGMSPRGRFPSAARDFQKANPFPNDGRIS